MASFEATVAALALEESDLYDLRAERESGVSDLHQRFKASSLTESWRVRSAAGSALSGRADAIKKAQKRVWDDVISAYEALRQARRTAHMLASAVPAASAPRPRTAPPAVVAPACAPWLRAPWFALPLAAAAGTPQLLTVLEPYASQPRGAFASRTPDPVRFFTPHPSPASAPHAALPAAHARVPPALPVDAGRGWPGPPAPLPLAPFGSPPSEPQLVAPSATASFAPPVAALPAASAAPARLERADVPAPFPAPAPHDPPLASDLTAAHCAAHLSAPDLAAPDFAAPELAAPDLGAPESAPEAAPLNAALPVVPRKTRRDAAAARDAERAQDLEHAARHTPDILALVRDGAMPWTVDAPPLVVERLRALAAEALLTTTVYKRHKVGRRGYELPRAALSPSEWRALLPPALLSGLAAYLCDEPALVSLSLIVAPPRAPPQDPHRDHGGGPRRAVCLAVSLTRAPITTLVAAGSHASDAHAHTWPLSALAQAAGAARGLLYDNYVVHAGAANDSDAALEQRVFLSFEGASEPIGDEAERRARIRRDHGYGAHVAMRCADLVSGA